MRTTRAGRAAAAIVIGGILVTAGWAAEKVYEALKPQPKETRYVTVEIGTPQNHKVGDRVVGSVAKTAVPIDAAGGDAAMQAGAKRAVEQSEEVSKLIAARKYTLVKTFEDPAGRTQYVYSFGLVSGEMAMNFSMPLDKVDSWQDYLKKTEAAEADRMQEIDRAVEAGRFRLIDLDVQAFHTCRDVATGQKLDILRVRMPAGEDQAVIRQSPVGESKTFLASSWAEHLKAIRDGSRELIEQRIVTAYKYEVTLADGRKTIFCYNGDKPLEKHKNPPAQGPAASRAAEGR
ncbi:MAG: hypothetical protein NT031_03285 [Planctomycetota bacterium]|nr:hypothetical protein [Planctomycetota bacterium]